jgi:hypothetical protein
VARSRPLPLVLLFFGLACFFTPHRAVAQVHWDVGAEAGVMKRILTRPSTNDPDGGFGPVIEIHGHVAVLPMLRVGLYLGHDIAPVSGEAARQITYGGLRVKFTPPLLRDPWRTWVFAGFGYAGVYGPSYHTTLQLSHDQSQPTMPTDTLVEGAGGGYFEVPLGVGAAYRLRRPWELTAELGARLGFGFTGNLYNLDADQHDRPAQAAGYPPLSVDSPSDTWGISLSVGVNFEL